MYLLSKLRDDDEEFNKLTKYELILETLRTHTPFDSELLYEINRKRSFSKETLQALADEGIALRKASEIPKQEVMAVSQGKRDFKQIRSTISARQTVNSKDLPK